MYCQRGRVDNHEERATMCVQSFYGYKKCLSVRRRHLQHGRAARLAHVHITPIQMQHPHRVAARRDRPRESDNPRVADGIVPEVEGFQLPNIQSKGQSKRRSMGKFPEDL